ncbi:MAG: hypothetical protein M1829_004341 [Trizodia sp. TS-e1964]|nr:MAG: hypothetical protein M1829_004341 [Trizodia sp. TS-e1964]
MASLALLSVPEDASVYISLDDLVLALDNWAIKDKFAFQTASRKKDWASFVCAESLPSGDQQVMDCAWNARGKRLELTNEWKLSILESKHSYLAVARVMSINKQTSPDNIKNAIWVHYSENISYKVAQEYRLRLFSDDIKTHWQSFGLLSSYKTLLKTQSPGLIIDLIVNDTD